MSWASADLPIINKAADDCVQFIIDRLTDSRGVHLETAISMAGSLAGVSMLRNAVASERINLTKLIRTKPGTPVFIDKVNDLGMELTSFMQAFCKSMNIDPQSGWNDTIPSDHQPLRAMVEMVREFEKPFIDRMNKQSLKPVLRPFAAGLAAIKLINMGTKMLNPDIGKAIALTSIVAASKTIPFN